MLPFSIKSLQHPIVKTCVKIRKSPGDQDHVLITGKKMIIELSQSFSLYTLFLREDLDCADFPSAEHIYQTTDAIIKKITGLQSTDGVCALIKKPTYQNLEEKKRLLVLDHINDPGNMGTLLRTALALGYDGGYLINGVCPFNDKALRAAKGATFYLPLQQGSVKDFIELSITKVLASLDGTPLDSAKISEPFALVLGNEAKGAHPEIKKICTPITIPMSEKSESLNVAVAGGILLYALVR